MDAVDYDRLDRLALELNDGFKSASPFPHTVIDDFLPAQVAEDLLSDFVAQQEPAVVRWMPSAVRWYTDSI